MSNTVKISALTELTQQLQNADYMPIVHGGVTYKYAPYKYVVKNSGDETITGTKTFANAQGTAPFAVTSTTQVAKLNASLLAGLDLTSFVYGTSASFGANGTTDLNTITKAGFYYCSNTAANMPPIADYYRILHLPFSSDGCTQLALGNNGFIYVRSKNAGAWISWTMVWTSVSDGSGSGLDADMVDGIESARIIYGDGIYATTATSNLNTLSKSGFYSCAGSATGVPSSDTSWLIIHGNYVASALYAFQIAHSISTTGIAYIRVQINGTWQAWNKLWNSANDGAGSGLETDKAPFATKTGTSVGTQGQIAFDANYIYCCTATNVWKRATLSSF